MKSKSPLSHRGRRAIFLISVLFFSLLIAMFVEAALILAPSGLLRASTDGSLMNADQACKSGIDWGRGRVSLLPTWNATAPQTFAGSGLFVTEGNGQVEGWVPQNGGWSRFRIRFNYQDGPQNSLPTSDNMDDPPAASMWQDFPYVSCNNLGGDSPRTVPLASSGSSYSSSIPWTSTQLTVPPTTLLLSVQGSCGVVQLDSSGRPSGFSGAVHTKTVQVMLKFGSNQPIADAAVMSAGDLAIQVYDTSSPILLTSTVSSQTARLRTKADLTVGNVYSGQGDLRHQGTMSNGTLAGNITNEGDAGNFYQIPSNKVRAPSGTQTLAAGVYVVDAYGNVTYYQSNYQDFATASPAPVGTPTALPTGMITGPFPSPTPKYQFNLGSDLSISGTGTVHDFALIPSGGAPQSANYGNVPSATPTAEGGDASGFIGSLGLAAYGISPYELYGGAQPTNSTQNAAWNYLLSHVPGVTTSTNGGGTHNVYTFAGGTDLAYNSIEINSNNGDGSGSFRLFGVVPSTLTSAFAGADTSDLSGLESSYGYTGSSSSPSSSPSAAPTAVPLLTPSDLLLNLQGSSGGLVLGNNNPGGSVIIGGQVKGTGAAITSAKDIELIGTSSEFSSTNGAAMGLNLYAQGNVTIDAFHLDSSGTASFHAINLQGIVYAWTGINMLAGNSTISAPFSLTGSMIAYGGNPASPPTPGAANTNIRAKSASLTFDPSYVIDLTQSGPFTLEVVSWHEF